MSDAETTDRYRYFLPITTRWMDNDTYGHINNVTYYSYFDTVANHYLIHEGGLDIHQGAVIGLVVESKCNYRAPLAYPDRLQAGLRVDKLGQRSVTYGIGIFKEGETQAAAHGYFVHVFVDRHSRKAVAIPERLRAALERLSTTVGPAFQALCGGNDRAWRAPDGGAAIGSTGG